MSKLTVRRVRGAMVYQVMNHLNPEVRDFYRRTYGSEEEAGAGESGMFTAMRGGGLIAAFNAEGVPVGMAGWTSTETLGYSPDQSAGFIPGQTVELKRVYVDDGYRGQGLSGRLESVLLAELFGPRETLRFPEPLLLVGETGEAQGVSKHVHSRYPYRERPPFGRFMHEPHSLFFEATASAGRAYAFQNRNQKKDRGEA